MLETLKQFNWLDIFVVILLARIVYIAVFIGFSVELFKLLGTLLATYLSLHYYTPLTASLSSRVILRNIPGEFLSFILFLILVVLGYFVFVFARNLCLRFIKLDVMPTLNKWGGFIFGVARGFLLVSLIVFVLAICPLTYLKNSVTSAYLGRQFSKIAPATYRFLWEGVMSKFMPQEKFNQAVLEVQNSFELKK